MVIVFSICLYFDSFVISNIIISGPLVDEQQKTLSEYDNENCGENESIDDLATTTATKKMMVVSISYFFLHFTIIY